MRNKINIMAIAIKISVVAYVVAVSNTITRACIESRQLEIGEFRFFIGVLVAFCSTSVISFIVGSGISECKCEDKNRLPVPTKVEVGSYCKETRTMSDFYCKSCGDHISPTIKSHIKYCSNCGVKLDWDVSYESEIESEV